jgi:hypothetical protein
MKHRYACVAIIACIGAWPLQSLADEPYTLRMGFQQGKSYVYADLVVAAVTQEMAGQEMKRSSRSAMVSRISADRVLPDGSFSLILQMDTMVVSSKSPRQDTTRLMTDLIGKRSGMVLTPLGKIASRVVIDSIKAAGPSMRSAAAREILRFHTLPEQPVVPGGQWSADVTDSNETMGGLMITVSTITYTLAGKEEKGGRSCLKIRYTGKLAIEGKGAMMGMEMFTEGKGSLSGIWYFDPKDGIMVAEEGAMDTDVTVAMTGQQNMTMPITTTSKITRALRSVEETTK